MVFKYSSIIRWMIRMRPVVFVVMVVVFLSTALFLNGYGCSRATMGLPVAVGIEVDAERVISPSECGGLFNGEWEYEEVDRDALLEGMLVDEKVQVDDVSAEDAVERGEMETEGNGEERVIRQRYFDFEKGRWRSVLGSKRHELIDVDTAGNLVLYETVDESHDARTVYDPPLILLYAEQEAGKVYAQNTQATIWSVKHPERKDDGGSVERLVLYEGDERIHTPATGTVTAYRVHVTQALNFRRADVDVDSTTWYVDGFGQVATFDTEKVRVFGLIGWDESTGLRLVRMTREE